MGGLLLPGAWGKEINPYEEFDQIVPDSQVTHFSWGKPLAGGPITALFIGPWFALRDVAELAERLDLKYDVAPLWDATHIGMNEATIPGSSEKDTLATLARQLGQKHSVIVIGNFDLGLLPEALLQQLVDCVSNGSGLVLANHRGALPPRIQEVLAGLKPEESSGAITRGIGASLTPEWPSDLSFVNAGAHGAGRVVDLNYVGEPPYSHFLVPGLSDPLHARDEFLDTYLSLIARAIRWAAGRDTTIWITSMAGAGPAAPAENEIPPDLPEEYIQAMKDGVVKPLYQAYTVKFNKAADKNYKVRAQAREPNRGLRVEYLRLHDLRKGEDSYLLKLPIGPGRYFVDFWLLDNKNVVEWHTQDVTVKDWPEMSDLAYSKAYLLPNDCLTVSLDIRAQYHRPRPSIVYARGVDSLGRLVADGSAPVPEDGGHVEVTLNFADLIANLVKVEVFAADTRNPHPSRWDLEHATYASRYFAVRAPRPLNGPIFAAEAQAAEEYNVRGYLNTLSRLGVDTLFLPGSEEGAPATEEARFYAAVVDFRTIPEVTRYVPVSEENNVRRPCLNDAAFRKAEAEKIVEAVKAFWTVGTNVYMLGKGNCLGRDSEDLCQCSECLNGLRAYLQNQYGDLLKLNQSWQSSFAGWDGVVPASRDEAAASGNYAPWLDFRLYMDTVFAGIHAYGLDVVRGTDPDGHAGFRARAGSSARLGYDWWQLASRLDALAIEPDPVTVELVRSYRPPSSFAALVCGGDPQVYDLAHAEWFPWYQVLHGMQCLWLAEPFGGAHLQTAAVGIEPDGTPSPVLEEMAGTVSFLKSGVGSLLLNAARKKPSIAILDSQPSFYLNQIDLSFHADTRDVENSIIKLLNHLGYPFDFVASAQVNEGKLREYALLILPMARAMSDDEIAAIKNFHAAGGAVIADVAPAQFDAHGTPRVENALDAVFNVTHKGPVQAGAAGDATLEIRADHSSASGRIADVTVDTAIETAAGNAAGTVNGAPVWVLSGSGKGFAALLNHPFPKYPLERTRDAELAGLMGALLEKAGARPLVPFETPEGLFHGEVFAFSAGKADVFAFLKDPDADGKKERIVLRPDSHRYVYDVVRGQRVKKGGNIKFDFRENPVAIYAVLPYEVTGVDVTTPDHVPPGKRLPVQIGIKTNGGVPGDHLFHVTLAREGGDPIPYYSKDVICKSAEAHEFIALARNEVPGTYVVTVQDVLAGRMKNVHVRIDYKRK